MTAKAYLIQLPGSPRDRLWLKTMEQAFEQLEREDHRPTSIMMAPAYWEGYSGRNGDRFRGVKVECDPDCPGIYLGPDPRDNLVELPPPPPAEPSPIEYRIRAGAHIHVRRGETYGEAVHRNLRELQEAHANLFREIHALADRAFQNRSTKAIAHKLLELIGVPKP